MMGEAPISRANIIVIDEASMIDKKTLDYIIKYKQAGAKVIFMGDNVYGDDRVTGKLDKLSKAYKKQKTKIPFTKLEETNEVYAIWDDQHMVELVLLGKLIPNFIIEEVKFLV